jgi:hypothetical protein
MLIPKEELGSNHRNNEMFPTITLSKIDELDPSV